MDTKQWSTRRLDAAKEFNQHENREDGAHIADSLFHGLTTLRQMLFTRVHDDVQEEMGIDSMLLPAAFLKTVQETEQQIEIFQIAESAAWARQRSYVSDGDWYTRWLGEMRLGDAFPDPSIEQAVTRYRLLDAAERRYTFTRVLEKTFREATRAPLVLYQLFPLSVAVVTSIAFRDLRGAREVRDRQMFWLPAIADCHVCHGRSLDNGEKCHVCGNPVWNFKWLTATD